MAQRLDKWLVYARFVKHRSDAEALIAGGHVRLNRNRVSKNGQALKPGDILTLTLYSGVRIIRVLGEAERRGPASAAQALYEDLTGPHGPHDAAAQATNPPA